LTAWRSLPSPTAAGRPARQWPTNSTSPTYGNWQELLEDPSIDAVCIGTWPYMHRTLTLAALESGKHVLCEARMATSAQEAQEMLDASRERPDLISQIVPSPLTFKIDRLLQGKIGEGYIGDIIGVSVQSLGNAFMDQGGPMHWRNDRDLSGYNILNMGIWYEAMIRWVGRATKVTAMTSINVNTRKDENGESIDISIPDHVSILAELANGATANMQFSAVTGLSSGNGVWIYGSEGTLHVDGAQNVYGGRRGDEKLAEIENPEAGRAYWRVEEEFCSAIRGHEKITRTPFEVGLHYMEFTEAVTRSAQTGQTVALPL